MNQHEKASQWAEQYLINKERTLILERQIVVETPWSVVYRIKTSQHVVYLKQVPETMFFEPDMLTFFHHHGCKNIPEIIAVNPELHCFLTQACGDTTLRELCKGQVDFPLLKAGVGIYTTMQRSLENKAQQLLALSIPDWRLDRFASLYYQLISQDKLLLDDGLTEKEIERLQQLYLTCRHLCEELSKQSIPETISHSDFQENNILLDEKTDTISIIDWGETVIAHPFFSLNGCLWNLTYFNGLKSTDTIYKQLQSACITPWLNMYDEKTLLGLFDIVRDLLGIYAALEYERLYVATQDNATRTIQQEKHGSIAGCLRTFLNSQT